MTGRVLPQVQAAEMGFLRRVHGATVRSCEIRRALNVEPLSGEILATLVGPRDQNAPRKTNEAGPAA